MASRLSLAGIAFELAALPPTAAVLQDEVRAFLANTLAAGTFQPHCDSWLGGHAPAFSRILAERGWLGMTFPPSYGGRGRTQVERFVVVAELLAAGAPVAAHWFADRQVGPLLLRYGTEEQRQRFVPAIARGECFFSIGMSEPGAGSDLAAVQTKAARVDGGWRLEGTKVWTSHAHRADFMVTLCRTSPGERHEGLSQVIVDLHASGVTARPIRLMTGEEHFCEVRLEDAFVPDDLVVGTVGQGWRQVMAELVFERSGPERFLSTFPLFVELVRTLGPAAGPHAAETVGRLTARMRTLFHLSLAVAARIDAGGAPSVEAAIVKDLGTRLEHEIIEAARLLVPPESASAELARHLREALLHSPGFTLRGGTSEILRGIVARGLT